jgi:hypothetical protein
MMTYSSNNCKENELDAISNEANHAQSDAMDDLEEKQRTSYVHTASKTKRPSSASIHGVSDDAKLEEDDDEESAKSEDRPEWHGIPWTDANVSMVFRNQRDINPVAKVLYSHLLLQTSANRTND